MDPNEWVTSPFTKKLLEKLAEYRDDAVNEALGTDETVKIYRAQGAVIAYDAAKDLISEVWRAEPDTDSGEIEEIPGL